jgi:hypothetical protein
LWSINCEAKVRPFCGGEGCGWFEFDCRFGEFGDEGVEEELNWWL